MNQRCIVVKTADLLQGALKYMKIKCQIDDGGKEGVRRYRQCMQSWEKYFAGKEMRILTTEFGREYFKGNTGKFCLGGREFTCHVLEQSDISQLTGGYFYLFRAPAAEAPVAPTEGDGGLAEATADGAERRGLAEATADGAERRGLAEATADGAERRGLAEATADGAGRRSLEADMDIQNWQIALLDAAREWLENYLRRCLPKGCFLSRSAGPGFYGMELGALPVIVRELDAASVGVALTPEGMMEPAMSVTGMFFTGQLPFRELRGRCADCMATGNCRMCQYFSEKREQRDV